MIRPAGFVALALLLACSSSSNSEPTHAAAGSAGAAGGPVEIAGGNAGGAGEDAGQAGAGELACGESPHVCPADAPTYSQVVGPLISLRCLPCHAPGGVESSRPLDTYASLFPRRGSVLTQVVSCAMPPTTSPLLTADERAALLTWLVCGAPDD